MVGVVQIALRPSGGVRGIPRLSDRLKKAAQPSLQRTSEVDRTPASEPMSEYLQLAPDEFPHRPPVSPSQAKNPRKPNSSVVGCISVQGANVLILGNAMMSRVSPDIDPTKYMDKSIHETPPIELVVWLSADTEEEYIQLRTAAERCHGTGYFNFIKVHTHYQFRRANASTASETGDRFPYSCSRSVNPKQMNSTVVHIFRHAHLRWHMYHGVAGPQGLVQSYFTRTAVLEFLNNGKYLDRVSQSDGSTANPIFHFSDLRNHATINAADATKVFHSVLFPDSPVNRVVQFQQRFCDEWMVVGVGGSGQLFRLHGEDAYLMNRDGPVLYGVMSMILDMRTGMETRFSMNTSATSKGMLHPLYIYRPRSTEIPPYSRQGRMRGIEHSLELQLVDLLEDVSGVGSSKGGKILNVSLENLSVEEQYEYVRSSNWVLAAEGASLVWSMFSPPNTTWIVVYDHKNDGVSPDSFFRHIIYHVPLFRVTPWNRLFVYEVYRGHAPPLAELKTAMSSPFRHGTFFLQVPDAPRYKYSSLLLPRP